MKEVPPRLIPCLLLDGSNMVQTVKFQDQRYLGDPRNAVRIFRDKRVDELVILDITATVENRDPDYQLLEELSKESFMPIAYGGGLSDVEQMERVHKLGYEKTVLSSHAITDPDLVERSSNRFGSQSVIVCIDSVHREDGSWEVVTHRTQNNLGVSPAAVAEEMVVSGAGELIINSVDRDGTMEGYDMDLVRSVTSAVDVPVVAMGGAGSLEDMRTVIDEGGASAAAAGSVFVYHGANRAVLINYPNHEKKASLFA